MSADPVRVDHVIEDDEALDRAARNAGSDTLVGELRDGFRTLWGEQ